MMCSTKRLMILMIAVLGVEGVAGSALAGLYIEGDMNSLTAVLLVILAMGCTFGFTIWFILRQAETGRRSKNPVIKAFAEQLFRDVGGESPKDPTAVLESLDKNIRILIDLMMQDRAEHQRDRWEKPL